MKHSYTHGPCDRSSTCPIQCHPESQKRRENKNAETLAVLHQSRSSSARKIKLNRNRWRNYWYFTCRSKSLSLALSRSEHLSFQSRKETRVPALQINLSTGGVKCFSGKDTFQLKDKFKRTKITSRQPQEQGHQ